LIIVKKVFLFGCLVFSFYSFLLFITGSDRLFVIQSFCTICFVAMAVDPIHADSIFFKTGMEPYRFHGKPVKEFCCGFLYRMKLRRQILQAYRSRTSSCILEYSGNHCL